MMHEEGVLDILVYLYEEYLCDDEYNNIKALQTDLLEAGFCDSHIEEAFSWLEEVSKVGKGESVLALGNAEGNIRIFSAEELRRFSKEAQGFLYLLEQNGLLDDSSRELVIERAMALQKNARVDLEQLQWVVLFVLYHYPGKESQFESYEGLFFSEDVMTVH